MSVLFLEVALLAFGLYRRRTAATYRDVCPKEGNVR
jgi:hypothetical protein